ncbi:MAG: prepilin peptidase [Deltaproteobacteria bacterium]|nr:prepilin peptidase [Deltaproteobacteria bacterium]
MPCCLPSWSLFVIAGIFGAILGSFANVCIVRMPKGESVIWPPSHCPQCKKRLRSWHNIPILSFLMLKGRCSFCSSKISAIYPFVEMICIILSVITWWYFRNPLEYFVYFLLFIMPLVIISFIDLRHMIIPDIISIPGIIIGIVVHTLFLIDGTYFISALNSIGGALLGGGILFIVAYTYEKLKKREGLGGGDVKLIAMLGAFLGFKAVLFVLLLSSILGSIIGIIMMIILRKDSKYAIPYGPFIALAGIVYLFFGEEFIRWYLSLFV